ncbi:MAG TPA: flagellar export protein FliJ [Clostridia bacterium]|jgi:flagellar export protein FliJ|nr:flagellar export protein FliJ [Clostridia bacterium]
MKRFVFTLKAVYDIAVSNEKQQKNLLRKIEDRIRFLYGKLENMLSELSDSRARCASDVDAGTDALRLAQYARYFESREELIAAQKQSIALAEKEREKIVEALVAIRKEIKSLESLREKQYEEYLAEEKREQEQAIGDVVSYQVASK